MRESMTVNPIDTYLDSVAEPQRSTLIVVRNRIRQLLPDAQECITYALPTWKVDGHSIAGIGAWKNHCSYFPMSGSVLPALEGELAGFSQSKGALRFPIDEPLSERLLLTLITARQAEVEAGKR
jgi:uncharacterized protein YdhG (YjbR/CyaY superfamily)